MVTDLGCENKKAREGGASESRYLPTAFTWTLGTPSIPQVSAGSALLLAVLFF